METPSEDLADNNILNLQLKRQLNTLALVTACKTTFSQSH